MLPRLAAMVCMATRGSASLCLVFPPVMASTVKVNGTNVISATSFVISILEKKLSSMSTSTRLRALFTFPRSPLAIHSNTPIFCSPAMTHMRQNRIANVRTSMYSPYPQSGGTMQDDRSANSNATQSTASFFMKPNTFSICPLSVSLTENHAPAFLPVSRIQNPVSYFTMVLPFTQRKTGIAWKSFRNSP